MTLGAVFLARTTETKNGAQTTKGALIGHHHPGAHAHIQTLGSERVSLLGLWARNSLSTQQPFHCGLCRDLITAFKTHVELCHSGARAATG
jgi:hypothetical protein